MKKLMKFMSMMAVCICAAGFFTSCSDDKDEPSSSSSGGSLVSSEQLDGTWTVKKMKMEVLGQTMEMTLEELKQNSGYSQFYDDVLTFSGNKVNGATYTRDGNRILLPWYEELGWWSTVSISGSEMTLFFDIVQEGVSMKLWTVYTKSRASFDVQTDGPALLPALLAL